MEGSPTSVAIQIDPTQVAKGVSIGEMRLLGVFEGGRSGASYDVFNVNE